MDNIKELLESLGLDPILALIIVVALIVIGSLLKLNPLGIRDRLKMHLHIPAPPGQARPLLKRDVDIFQKKREFRDGKVMMIDHVVLTIENVGSETAENHAPQVWIELGDNVVFDNRKELANAESLGSIPPTGNVGFEMLDLLSTGSQYINDALRLYGMEAALVNKEFVVHTVSSYTAPDGIRKFKSPMFTLRFVWTSKSKKEVRAILRESYEDQQILTKPNSALHRSALKRAR